MGDHAYYNTRGTKFGCILDFCYPVYQMVFSDPVIECLSENCSSKERAH